MKVLIVEDGHLIANSIKKGLEQEDYNVLVEYNGDDGLETALLEKPDLIILDLMLPKLSGFEVCKILRQKNFNSPILILSAKSELEDKVTGLELGADDYLTKPFAFEELLARLKALTRRNKIKQKILSAKDIVLDSSLFTVTKNKKQIKLTKKEFLLLEFLLKNKNSIVSKEKIIERVWEYDSSILPNTVEQTVKSIRNKASKNLITTVRGFGYKITD